MRYLFAFAGALLVELLAHELRGWGEVWIGRLVRSATLFVPPPDRSARQEEWLAESEAYGDRRLAALYFAVKLRLCAPALGRALGWYSDRMPAILQPVVMFFGALARDRGPRAHQRPVPTRGAEPADLLDMLLTVGSIVSTAGVLLAFALNVLAGLCVLAVLVTAPGALALYRRWRTHRDADEHAPRLVR
jgi:hypothetical protein